MKLDDFRHGKLPQPVTPPVASEISDAESEAAWAELQRRMQKNMSVTIPLSGANPLHNSSAAAEMAKVFATIKVGDVLRIGHKEIVVTQQMWKDAKHCIRELVGYQWANWIFPNIPDDTLGSFISRMYLSTLFWRFYVDYFSDEPPGLGLVARLKYRFWSS